MPITTDTTEPQTARAPGSLFVPRDVDEALKSGAMCGHGALAAALGIPVLEAMKLLPKPGWINVPMMKAAISNAGRTFFRIAKPDPGETAVIMVQFTGPWTEPGAHPMGACRHRHWVATRDNQIWDINWPWWMKQDSWKALAPELLPKRSTGWDVWGALRISNASRDTHLV